MYVAQQKISNHTQRINTLEQNDNDHNQQINVMNKNVTSINKEMHDLNQRLTNISNTEIIITNGINGSMLYTKAQGETVQRQVENINTSVSALMSMIAEKDGYIENLETELNNTREDLAQANQRINAIVEQLNNSGADASTIAAWALAAAMTAITLAVCTGCLVKMRRDKVVQQNNHHPMRIQSISSYPDNRSNSVINRPQQQYNMSKRSSNKSNSTIIEMNEQKKVRVTYGGGNNSVINEKDVIAISELENAQQWSNKSHPKRHKKDDFLNEISSHDAAMNMVKNDIFIEMDEENQLQVNDGNDEEGIIISEKFTTNAKIYKTPNNSTIFGHQNDMIINGDDDDIQTAGNVPIAASFHLSTNDSDEEENQQLQNDNDNYVMQ
ncbi:MAG: hypothetical protein GY821_06430 [Gammaproteobacteria bacterium]|nr:hypothetical protein [Gammaproteobacteria bacterium]